MACGQVEGTCLQGGGQGEGSLQLGREYVFLTLDNSMWLSMGGSGMTWLCHAYCIRALYISIVRRLNPKLERICNKRLVVLCFLMVCAPCRRISLRYFGT